MKLGSCTDSICTSASVVAGCLC